MAYVKKYESTFYNYFGKEVVVELYQEGGSVGSSSIRVKSLEIIVNYVDDNTPVIGTGCNLIIVNQGAFDAFEDLLMNYEKQWKIKVYYEGAESSSAVDLVFEGYLICDLNEQQLLDNAEITLQFTNYLKRLEDVYLSSLSDISLRKSISTLISDAILNTLLLHNVQINSTLFEQYMLATENDSFLNQVLVENSLFYTDSTSYDDALTVLNKILKPFHCFFYAYGDKWMIERYEDIGRVGAWVQHTIEDVWESVPSLKKVINKQDGDFKYINSSQSLQYNSGAKILKVNLNDKVFESLVFNNYTEILSDTVSSFTDLTPAHSTSVQPKPEEIDVLRHWYQHPEVSSITKGYDYRGVSRFFTFTVPSESYNEWIGISYKFVFNRNLSVIDGIQQKTKLNISYKIILPEDYKEHHEYTSRFQCVIKASIAGHFTPIFSFSGSIYFGSIEVELVVYDNLYLIGHRNEGGHVVEKSIRAVDNDTGVLDVDFSFPLDYFMIKEYNDDLTSSWWHVIASATELPETMEASITFLPTIEDISSSNTTLLENTIGDIKVTVSADPIDNEITNTLNEDFVKTEDIDLDIFDLSNINFINGPFVQVEADSSAALDDGLAKTSWWYSAPLANDLRSLVNWLVESKMKKLAQTTRKLIASILYDGHLKPFTIVQDNALVDGSSNPINFILLGYTWDLVNGAYQIEAEEYPDTDITITTDPIP